ncbi:MAG: S9 family peptidase [Chloroflexi bacterium]|nr:S9 family peptidase [Chloroflexota bacterium]
MSQAQRKLTVSDAVEFKSVHDAQVSPDGAWVAFEVGDRTRTDTKLMRSAIWLVSAQGGDARQIARGPRADRRPRWSPDSQWLAFLSDRAEDGHMQVCLLPRDMGEASPLTEVKGHIDDYVWAADGKRIYLLIADPQSDEEKRRHDAKDDALEFEEHPKLSRVHAVDLATRTVAPLTAGAWHAWEFDVSAAGDRIAFVASDTPYEWSWYQSRISVCAPGAASETVLHQSKRQLARPLLSPDGAHVAFLTSTWSDRGVTAGDLYVVPVAGGEARNLTPGYVGSVSWMKWSADGRTLTFLALEETRQVIGEIDLAGGAMRKHWSGDVSVSNGNQPVFSASTDGRAIALVRESASAPRDVWLGRRAGDALEWKRLTDMFPHVDEFEPVAMESIHWFGADGLAMQGYLLKPRTFQPGTPHPMVTVVHGGPTSAYYWQYPLMMRWIGMLAAAGLVVFLPNPRGSTGRGVAFAEANLDDMGGKDFQDIMTGVSHLIAQGIADPARLGIAGWSYGGFMSMWAVGQTDRFKAAMAGAGIANWRSFHGLTKYPTFDTTFYRADPYDSDKENPYELFSALTYVKRIKTPTLIVHGERDPDVPVAQAYEFHRALKDHGVETQLVVYPRERHGFSEKAHNLDLWKRVVDWFVKRLVQ